MLFVAIAPPPPPPVERAPRLRTLLPNGAIALGETRPGTDRFRAEAFIAQPEVEVAGDEGRRHLIEHLVAARTPELDFALGAVGASFGAATSRDGMRIWVEAPSSSEDLAVSTLDSILRPFVPEAAAIVREASLIGRERLLLSPAERAANAGWSVTFGAAGASPIGRSDDLAEATPDDLARRWARLLLGRRVAIGLAGPGDVDALNARAVRIASRFAPGPTVRWAPRVPVASGGALPGENGAALAVGSVEEPETLAALGAALSIAGDLEGGAVAYTPSVRGAAITLSASDAGLDASALRPTAGAIGRAGAILRRFLSRLASTPDESLGVRLSLLRQNPALNPEALLERAEAISPAMWGRAFAAWAAVGRE